MGLQLYLDIYSQTEELQGWNSIQLGRLFFDEIIRSNPDSEDHAFYQSDVRIHEILTESEIDVLQPEKIDDKKSFDDYKKIDPEKLKNIFVKIDTYLNVNAHKNNTIIKDKFQRFHTTLSELINTCEQAIKQKQPVIWRYGW